MIDLNKELSYHTIRIISIITKLPQSTKASKIRDSIFDISKALKLVDTLWYKAVTVEFGINFLWDSGYYGSYNTKDEMLKAYYEGKLKFKDKEVENLFYKEINKAQELFKEQGPSEV